jgi:hypothetical protein
MPYVRACRYLWELHVTGGHGEADLPVRIGQVLALAEEDYRFGLGPLRLRVTGLLHVQELADGPWLYLRGVTVRWDGSEGEARQVLVRMAALPGQATPEGA